MEEQSYDPVLPMKVGNRRASERSGHGTHWREGRNRCTHRISVDADVLSQEARQGLEQTAGEFNEAMFEDADQKG